MLRRRALCAELVAALRSARSVGIRVVILADERDRGLTELFAYHRTQLGERHLSQKLIPFFIVVICDVFHVVQLYTLFHTDVGAFICRRIARFRIVLADEIFYHLGGRGYAVVRFGICVPIAAREIRNKVAVTVYIGILHLVANDLARRRARVRRIVSFVEMLFMRLCRISDDARAVMIEHARLVFCFKHVVERVVAVVADSEEIIALVEHVAAFLGRIRAVGRFLVVSREEIVVRNDRYGILFALAQ